MLNLKFVTFDKLKKSNNIEIYTYTKRYTQKSKNEYFVIIINLYVNINYICTYKVKLWTQN